MLSRVWERHTFKKYRENHINLKIHFSFCWSKNLWTKERKKKLLKYFYKFRKKKELLEWDKILQIILICGSQCSWTAKILMVCGEVILLSLQCRTLHYFVKCSLGRKLVGKGNSQNPQTLVPQNKNNSTKCLLGFLL